MRCAWKRAPCSCCWADRLFALEAGVRLLRARRLGLPLLVARGALGLALQALLLAGGAELLAHRGRRLAPPKKRWGATGCDPGCTPACGAAGCPRHERWNSPRGRSSGRTGTTLICALPIVCGASGCQWR
jgi:hypothetical protein